MSILMWSLLFGLHTIFAVWVVFLGGADWLEGTLLSLFVVSTTAAEWTPGGIKVIVALTWIAGLIFFVIGLFEVDARHFVWP
jgi:hypothetical protein